MSGKKSSFRQFIRDSVSEYDREEMVAECWKRFKKNRKKTLDAITEMQRFHLLPSGAFSREHTMSIRGMLRKKSGKGLLRMTVDVSKIKDEYDEQSKIIKGLAILGTRLIKDNDFRMELGVPIDRWKAVSNMPKFNRHKKELKGRIYRGVYWGNEEVIAELAKSIAIL